MIEEHSLQTPRSRRKHYLIVLIVGVLLFTLPFHFVILSISAQVGVPQQILRVLPLWKELLLLILLLLFWPKLIKKITDLKIGVFDLLVLCLFTISIVYSFNAILWGIRSTIFFFGLPYLLGRFFTTTDQNSRQIIRILTAVAFIASISAIVEKFLLPPDFWVRVGLVKYLNFTGLYSPAPYGLPWTFFNQLGFLETGSYFQRSGGVFANPLGLGQGLAVLLALPVAAVLQSTKVRVRDISLIALIFIAIFLSGSRTNIVIAFIVILLINLGKKRYDLLIVASLISIVLLTIIIFSSESIFNYVVRTLTFQEHSARFHLDAWVVGLDAFWEHPFGYGVAAAGAIGTRVQGDSAIGGESDYVVTMVQAGIIGFLFFVLVRLAALHITWKLLAKRNLMSDEASTLVCLSFAALLVVVLAGLTSQVSLFPRIVAWFFLGYVYTLAQNLKRTQRQNGIV